MHCWPCFEFWVLFCNGCWCSCCQIITYVSLIECLLSGASQPTSRPARWDEFVCFFFVSWISEIVPQFTKHYTRNDLRLVFHLGICFVMVFNVFVWFCSQSITCVSLNRFVLLVFHVIVQSLLFVCFLLFFHVFWCF